MLDEQELSVSFENAFRRLQSSLWVRNGTQGPGHHYGVNALIRKAQRFFSGLRKKLDRYPSLVSSFARHPLKFARGVYAINALNIRGIERKIQARPNADLKHFPASMRYPPGAQPRCLFIAHRKVNHAGQDVFSVERHRGPIGLRGLRAGARRRGKKRKGPELNDDLRGVYFAGVFGEGCGAGFGADRGAAPSGAGGLPGWAWPFSGGRTFFNSGY